MKLAIICCRDLFYYYASPSGGKACASQHSLNMDYFQLLFDQLFGQQVALVSEGAYSVFGGPNSRDDAQDQ